MKKEIITKDAPEAIGAYAQAIESNKLIFTSGQLGMKPGSSELEEGLKDQMHQVMKNLQSVLEAGGSNLNKIIKTTIFLADIDNFETVNNIYESYLIENFPARSAFQVAHLPMGALVEIEVIASR